MGGSASSPLVLTIARDRVHSCIGRFRYAASASDIDVHKLIEPFVHPTVPSFRCCSRSSATIGDPFHDRLRPDSRIDHHRIFHAGAWSILQRQLRKLIRKPEPRIVLQRVTRDFTSRAHTCTAARRRAEVVQIHGHCAPLLESLRAWLVHTNFLRGRPREIVHRIGVKPPRTRRPLLACSRCL